MSPHDGATTDLGPHFFEWETEGDVASESCHFALQIKGKMPIQTPAEAMEQNDVVHEVRLTHESYAMVDLRTLPDEMVTFVWRVIARPDFDSDVGAQLESDTQTFYLDAQVNPLSYLDVFQGDTTLSKDRSSAAQFDMGIEPKKSSKRTKKSPPNPCPNGDFESANLSGWEAYFGDRSYSSTVNINALTPGTATGTHTITNAGIDPVLQAKGVMLSTVGCGNHAVRLNDGNASGGVAVISYTFIVTPALTNFAFKFAAVLSDGGHPASEQPFFSYIVKRGSGIFFGPPGHQVVAARQVTADPSNPFLKNAGGITYRDWTPTCIDLSSYVGQTVTIMFVAADCAQQGHFGYAYIDCLCTNVDAQPAFTMPATCCASASTLIADGSASLNDTSHFWSVEESDANWGRNPATEVSQWFVAQQAGPFDLISFLASKGRALKCNTYYRVKLAVSNECTPWAETVKLLLATCPEVSAGPDRCVSCTPNGTTTTLGSKGVTTGMSYVWSPSAGLNNPNIKNPTHTQGSVTYPITYTVTATDAKGCIASDQVTLYCKPPNVELTKAPDCCKITLFANVTNASSISWSTGATDVNSIEVASAGTYSVTATNPCGSVTRTITVSALQLMTGDFHPLAIPSIISPTGGSISTFPQDYLYFKDIVVGTPAGIEGVPNSYNATEYLLRIFNRWGSVIYEKQDKSCAGWPNWGIFWDGTDSSGAIVPVGTYTWQLNMKNCSHTEWTPAIKRDWVKRYCIKWATFLGIKLWCKEYNVPDGTTEDTYTEFGAVTVV